MRIRKKLIIILLIVFYCGCRAEVREEPATILVDPQLIELLILASEEQWTYQEFRAHIEYIKLKKEIEEDEQ